MKKRNREAKWKRWRKARNKHYKEYGHLPGGYKCSKESPEPMNTGICYEDLCTDQSQSKPCPPGLMYKAPKDEAERERIKNIVESHKNGGILLRTRGMGRTMPMSHYEKLSMYDRFKRDMRAMQKAVFDKLDQDIF